MKNLIIKTFNESIYKNKFTFFISIFYSLLLIYSNQMWDGSHFNFGLNNDCSLIFEYYENGGGIIQSTFFRIFCLNPSKIRGILYVFFTSLIFFRTFNLILEFKKILYVDLINKYSLQSQLFLSIFIPFIYLSNWSSAFQTWFYFWIGLEGIYLLFESKNIFLRRFLGFLFVDIFSVFLFGYYVMPAILVSLSFLVKYRFIESVSKFNELFIIGFSGMIITFFYIYLLEGSNHSSYLYKYDFYQNSLLIFKYLMVSVFASSLISYLYIPNQTNFKNKRNNDNFLFIFIIFSSCLFLSMPLVLSGKHPSLDFRNNSIRYLLPIILYTIILVPINNSQFYINTSKKLIYLIFSFLLIYQTSFILFQKFIDDKLISFFDSNLYSQRKDTDFIVYSFPYDRKMNFLKKLFSRRLITNYALKNSLKRKYPISTFFINSETINIETLCDFKKNFMRRIEKDKNKNKRFRWLPEDTNRCNIENIKF